MLCALTNYVNLSIVYPDQHSAQTSLAGRMATRQTLWGAQGTLLAMVSSGARRLLITTRNGRKME